jgi:hypothetical protein
MPKTTGSSSGLGGYKRGGKKDPNTRRVMQRLAGTTFVVSNKAIYINSGGQIDLLLDATASSILTDGTTGLAFAVQAANTALLGPATGAAAAPTFRALVAADLPAGTSTITSVAIVAPASVFTISGSPITTGAGTLTLGFQTQAATTFLAGPASGAAATPTFRAITTGDLVGNTSAVVNATTLLSVVVPGNTIANTAAATFFNAAYTLPGGVMTAGTSLRVKISGTYGATGTPTLTLVYFFAGQGMLTTTAFTTAIPGVTEAWWSEAEIICFTNGSSGTINAQGRAIFQTGLTTAQIIAMPVSTTFTVDTTTNQSLQIQAKWGTANAANTITLLEFIVDLST